MSEELFEYLSHITVLEPILVLGNSDNLTSVQATDLATQIVEHISDLPLAIVPEARRQVRVDYIDFFIVSGKSSDLAPCVHVYAKREEIESYKFLAAALSVERLVLAHTNHIKESVGAVFVQALGEVLQLQARQLLKLKTKRKTMSYRDLPLSLQPTIRAFDADAPEEWLEAAKEVYVQAGLEADKVPALLGNFLPTHLLAFHNQNKIGKKWEEYRAAMVEYMMVSKDGSSIRSRILALRKKSGETTPDFLLRALALAQSAKPAISGTEVVRLMIEIMPVEHARLVINSGCTDGKDLIKRVKDALENVALLDKGHRSEGAMEQLLEEKLSKWEKQIEEKLGGKKNPTQDRLVAFLDNYGEEKQETVEEKILKKLEKLEKSNGKQKKPETQEEKMDALLTMFTNFTKNKDSNNKGKGKGNSWGRDGNGNDGNYSGGNSQGNSNWNNGNGNNAGWNNNNGGNGGNFRGGFRGRGRGRGAYGNGGRQGPSGCFACKDPNHWLSDCPKFQNFLKQ